MENKKCCGTCMGHFHHKLNGWICDNVDSENWGLETDYNDVCDDYQAREEIRK